MQLKDYYMNSFQELFDLGALTLYFTESRSYYQTEPVPFVPYAYDGFKFVTNFTEFFNKPYYVKNPQKAKAFRIGVNPNCSFVDPVIDKLFNSHEPNQNYKELQKSVSSMHNIAHYANLNKELKQDFFDKLYENFMNPTNFELFVHTDYTNQNNYKLNSGQLIVCYMILKYMNDEQFISTYLKALKITNNSPQFLNGFHFLNLNFENFTNSKFVTAFLSHSKCKYFIYQSHRKFKDSCELFLKSYLLLDSDMQKHCIDSVYKNSNDKAKANLFKFLSESDVFDEDLKKSYLSLLGNHSTDSLFSEIKDPRVLAKQLSCERETISFAQETNMPLATIFEFYGKIFTKKSFPMKKNAAFTIHLVINNVTYMQEFILSDVKNQLLINVKTLSKIEYTESNKYIYQNSLDIGLLILDKFLMCAHKEKNPSFLSSLIDDSHPNKKLVFEAFNEFKESELKDKLDPQSITTIAKKQKI